MSITTRAAIVLLAVLGSVTLASAQPDPRLPAKEYFQQMQEQGK